MFTCTEGKNVQWCMPPVDSLHACRRYKRLNVRYSRLQQTPVRFTFTQGGEMVEDEDYEGYSDEDDDTADKNSFKIEKS